MAIGDPGAFRDAAAREAAAATRSLVAAERAVEEGRLNVAKVLRAHALGARQRSLALTRVADEATPASDAVRLALDDAGATERTMAGVRGLNADEILRSARSAARVLQVTLAALDEHRDVPESKVAQFVWGCEVCGLLVEAERPEVCPSCGSIGGEFAMFAPFFSGTPEHLARRQPDEILEQLRGDGVRLASALSGHSDEELRVSPAAGEWCSKEIAGHLVDIADLALRRLHAAVSGEEPPPERTALPWKLLDTEDYPNAAPETIAARFAASCDALAALLAGFGPEGWRKRVNMMSGSTLAIDVGSWVANHNTAHLQQLRARFGERP